MDMTHFDPKGDAIMVDISEKPVTERTATAEGILRMSVECFDKVKSGGHKKGDVLGVARIAGIMGAKQTSGLIPLCHNIGLTSVSIDFEMLEDENAVRAVCTVGCEGRTGAEMEALTGVNIALLTVYDMCKAVDKGMVMDGIRLIAKSGGKSGDYRIKT
ncbi:MAG: cyclic pyranopterin monophosphate synthase MoaC [Lachnospiraceae bacterium]|nr:cyclic pyranopterin monophosphate synthase MoaC [Lachnospiraceae bacterium]